MDLPFFVACVAPDDEITLWWPNAKLIAHAFQLFHQSEYFLIRYKGTIKND